MGLKCILLTDMLELLIDMLIGPLSNTNERPSSKIPVEYYNSFTLDPSSTVTSIIDYQSAHRSIDINNSRRPVKLSRFAP